MNSNILHREINLFFIALTFLTRLPAPLWVEFHPENMNASARYYPLVGVVIGVITASIYAVFVQVFSIELSVLLSMLVSVLVTGAFHEDGLADCCDGFGGGGGKSHILTIMKDSCLGTYGAVGLGLLLAIKFFALSSLPAQSIAFVLVLAHSFSRLIAVSLMYSYEYVQDEAISKVKPMASQLSTNALLFSIVSVLPLLIGALLMGVVFSKIVFLILGLIIFRYLAGWYLVKRIGGYTGDCLGAVQQIAEVLIYLILIISIDVFLIVGYV